MKARDQFRKTQPTDFLVCFPPRAHLALMPKPICSPSRGAEPNKRSHHHRRRNSFTRFGGGGIPASSPLLWAKNKQIAAASGGSAPENSEPTSPKVTCAGQIKVRHKGGAACKSWQSVMEEIERIHIRRKNKKKSPANWIGIKKEVMQFLTCLRNIKFDFRCFGAIPPSEITSDEEDDGEEEEFNGGGGEFPGERDSRAAFSKWFMVLENGEKDDSFDYNNDKTLAPPPPPANALLLMRCRSAPAKSWQEEKEEEEENSENTVKREEKKVGKNLKALMEEENRMNNKELEENYNDYYRISSEIVKETWVNVGENVKDPLSRSRSWKR